EGTVPPAMHDAEVVRRLKAAGGTVPSVPNAVGTPAMHDAEVVRRLKAAGAVIVGKTNTCELGQWPFTSGPGFGHTRNPWSRRHTPGGSSGGSAA
ncbi:amidase family protein, partial [Mycobacterium intracellulare]|uniref:amidase family protein n=1 Tax=Mycobacterium intracellulare TaxID=1767 RepID=UPI0022A8B817